MKKALITGIYSQDGFYLTQLLLAKGYRVYGFVEKILLNERAFVADNVMVYECSVTDDAMVRKLVAEIKPDECYHFAAVSFVGFDPQDELTTLETNLKSTQLLLASLLSFCPACKFYFAGSSELFGNPDVSPQDESSRFNPRSMYGISKLASYYLVKKYREHHGLYACTGLAYNHESPRRGLAFVTRKITSTVAKISLGLEKKLYLGNLDGVRDWGYSPEYVQAMWLMLNCKNGPNDYVIATGVPRTVRDFLQAAFLCVGLDYRDFVEIKACFIRPTEKIPLIGNPVKIKHDLGWEATRPFEQIVEEMVMADIELLKERVV